MSKTLAILTADIHLRDDNPKCRKDDFLEAQMNKLLWLGALQKKHKCPILDAGDLFHKWKVSPFLINFALRYLPSNFFTVAGNHDLPQHNIELLNQSGLGVLLEAGKINILTGRTVFDNFITYGFGWNNPITNNKSEENLPKVALAHTMTYKGNKPYPQCTDLEAEVLLCKNDGYDLILTGHNHKCFIVQENMRFLVNAGSLTRQTADQLEYKPAVHLWKVDDNGRYSIESEYLPIEKDVMNVDYLERKTQTDSRMDAFVQSISGDWDIGISYEHNMESCMNENNVNPQVKNIILKAMGK